MTDLTPLAAFVAGCLTVTLLRRARDFALSLFFRLIQLGGTTDRRPL